VPNPVLASAEAAAVAPAAATEKPSPAGSDAGVSEANAGTIPLPIWSKIGLASLFALITPIGMAIGLGVLNKFNENNRETLIALGTLQALSAGILVWVGVVEMWAHDWMGHGNGGHGHGMGRGGELADAGPLKVSLGMFGLIAGLALMSLLGKWA
jgi:zinc transporter 1/2/3